MKRTPPWVFIAAVGIQLAALGLCVWAMEHWGGVGEAPAEPRPAPPQPPDEAVERREALPPPPPFTPDEIAYIRDRIGEPVARDTGGAAPAPEPAPAPQAAPPPPPSQAVDPAPGPERSVRPGIPSAPRPGMHLGDPRPAVPPGGGLRPSTAYVGEPRHGGAYIGDPRPAPEPPVRPRFGPPPDQNGDASDARSEAPPAISRFITEVADDTSQLVTGRAGQRTVTFGFYADGNIRFVDIDGGRYTGKAESARARMREIDGTRAFTVQIGVAGDGRLQATFTGGLHEAATLALEPVVGWSAE